jgi:nucleoside permease NupC
LADHVADRHSRDRDGRNPDGPQEGTKTVLNEFVAYLEFAQLPAQALSPARA